MTKVGFVFGFRDRNWLGGISYFRNLLWALHTLPGRTIEPVILTGERTPRELLEGMPPVRVHRTALLDRRHPWWCLRKACQAATGTDLMLERYLASKGVAVLSHYNPLGPRAGLPTLGWIPDFQHLHLPELFSAEEIALRERLFDSLCQGSARILVSSHHARRDLQRRFPAQAARARVLQFVANMNPLAPVPPVAELERRHGFRGPYFHVPNQMWQHKNHGVVIEALRILKQRGIEALVLSTGQTVDHRQPGYGESLLRRVEQAGLQQNFRVLGVVPYADLAGLMRGAIALINPSRFEGWSTTVEEAKSLNKRILLSDIDVHREQAPPRGVYFAPDDAMALADAMAQTLATPDDPGLEADRARAARDDLARRRQRFAHTYQEIVMELVG
ncbi:glycosyltransferase involved in cell wall biosynthesis [Cupriavidus gilardii J11]|uniref:Glycosyltransferase involved in cell wall biosynthesis n=1 Tax=Cupriavidus gilardii J11 TaxID=936133 RepID=A0A562B927_9BURK|nr:glycosyltransferase family 1 protein [Cupriavidus gilardii]TWG81410.1 glycosyltransferase involved in cell wall biosynthesis [Cupriavidus gilardii J11]